MCVQPCQADSHIGHRAANLLQRYLSQVAGLLLLFLPALRLGEYQLPDCFSLCKVLLVRLERGIALENSTHFTEAA